MNELTAARGVYFLSNNKLFEQTVAFLRSFRTHNPTIALCLIPSNSKVDRILALQSAYSFSVLDDADLLAGCDAISEQFHGHVLGTYRKLAAWEGIFDAFIYIDVDTVVLAPIDFAFEFLDYGNYVASHSNIESIRPSVWKDSIYDTNLLTAPQISYSVNTGFFVSSRGLFNLKHCQAKVAGALQLKDSMELFFGEQSFLNYLVVTSGYAYTSFTTLHASGVALPTQFVFWAGNPGGRVEGGKLHFRDDVPIFLLHWTGIWQKIAGLVDELPYRELWEHYRRPQMAPDLL